jgi:hypothetical protein
MDRKVVDESCKAEGSPEPLDQNVLDFRRAVGHEIKTTISASSIWSRPPQAEEVSKVFHAQA